MDQTCIPTLPDTRQLYICQRCLHERSITHQPWKQLRLQCRSVAGNRIFNGDLCSLNRLCNSTTTPERATATGSVATWKIGTGGQSRGAILCELVLFLVSLAY